MERRKRQKATTSALYKVSRLLFRARNPLELHMTTSELWFGQEQEGILP